MALMQEQLLWFVNVALSLHLKSFATLSETEAGFYNLGKPRSTVLKTTQFCQTRRSFPSLTRLYRPLNTNSLKGRQRL
jgi:hypothetical protein